MVSRHLTFTSVHTPWNDDSLINRFYDGGVFGQTKPAGALEKKAH